MQLTSLEREREREHMHMNFVLLLPTCIGARRSSERLVVLYRSASFLLLLLPSGLHAWHMHPDELACTLTGFL
jgi:hypothetical protein